MSTQFKPTSDAYQFTALPIVAHESVPKNEAWLLSPLAARVVQLCDEGFMSIKSRDMVLEADMRLKKSVKIINLQF